MARLQAKGGGWWRALLALAALLGTSGVLQACLVEERVVDEECFAFCSEVQAECPDQYAVYPSQDACMAVCREMDRGVPGEEQGANTLECRLEALRSFDLASCRYLGPGGNGRCGNDCEAFCQLRQRACGDVEPDQPDIADVDTCLASCQGLPGSDAAGRSVPAERDSLQCRLGHLSAALVSKSAAAVECIDTRTTLAPEAKCKAGPYAAIDECASYCALVMSSCTGPNQVYVDAAQCEKVCPTFDIGVDGDKDVNTVHCRAYHAGAAVGDPVYHCLHAGPTGDGHCGPAETSNCDSYCSIVERACPDSFGSIHADHAACTAACMSLPGVGQDALKETPRYSVANVQLIDDELTPTLACRVLHAVNASENPNDPFECAAALAAGPPCE